jgi:hypothetical protein
MKNIKQNEKKENINFNSNTADNTKQNFALTI